MRRTKQKIETFLQQEKHKLIQMKIFAVEKNKKNSIYKSILQQKFDILHQFAKKKHRK